MDAPTIILWVIVVVLLIWVIYLQFNTVKTSKGYNSYNLSILHSDSGDTDICAEQKELESFAHYMRLYNKPDNIPWYTLDESKAQLDPNLRWTLENSKTNTAAYILTEGLAVLVSASFLTPNMSVTRYRVTSGGLNSYAVLLTRPNADNVLAVGLCSYTNVQGYKEHIKHLDYIVTKIATPAGGIRIFVECAIFNDHLAAMTNWYLFKFGLSCVTPRTNKLDKNLRWLVVGGIELYRSQENLKWKDPTYSNPSKLSDTVMQLQYTRTGGVLDAGTKTMNPVLNFNYLLAMKSTVVYGVSRFSIDTNNIQGLTSSVVSHTVLLNSPIIRYSPIVPPPSLDTITRDLTDINSSLTDQLLRLDDFEARVTALENE
jgi:hypothetical protein